MFDELNTNQDQAQEAIAQQPIQEAQATQETQKESNFRILRERAEAAERRSQELERMIHLNQQQPQPKVEEDDDMDINDDTYIEGKQLKKYVKKLKQELKETKKTFEEQNQRNAITQAEIRLKSQFTDFDAVVTKDNLSKLADQKPALYRSIMANQDIYDRGYTAYEMLRNSGYINEYAQTDKRLEDNRSKPRSAANANPQTGETPLARVGDYDRRVLTEDRKDQLRRQVEEAKKNR